MKLDSYCPNLSTGKTFMNLRNSKTNEGHKCVLNFSHRLDLRRPNEHVVPQN